MRSRHRRCARTEQQDARGEEKVIVEEEPAVVLWSQCRAEWMEQEDVSNTAKGLVEAGMITTVHLSQPNFLHQGAYNMTAGAHDRRRSYFTA